MKEIDLFESWLNSLTEAQVLPTDTQAQQELIRILGEPLEVGSDATNATELLHTIFMTPELADDLHDLASTDPNADARPVVLSKLNDYRNQPGISAVIAKIKNATATGEQPASPTPPPDDQEAVDTAAAPAPEQPAPPPPEQPAANELEPEQPVAEAEYEQYSNDLATILKNAGVEPCNCPAEDYITGRDPHVKESRRPFEEGVIGSTVGGALGSALGPAGTLAGAAAGDWAGEKIAGTEWGKKAAKWTADKAGSVAASIGGSGAGQLAKGATDYMLSPDSDSAVGARTATGATGAALAAAGHIPGIAGKIAKGAGTAYNLYNKGSRMMSATDSLEKAAAAGATAYDLLKQPGAAEMAKGLLSKGSSALSDPKVRDTLMKVAGGGASAAAAAKAAGKLPGGLRGAAKSIGGKIGGAVGAAGTALGSAATGVADRAGGFGRGFTAGLSGRPDSVTPQRAKPQAPAQQAPTPAPATPSASTVAQPSTGDGGLAQTADYVQGHGASLQTGASTPRSSRPIPKRGTKPPKRAGRVREENFTLHEHQLNTELERLITLSGIKNDK